MIILLMYGKPEGIILVVHAMIILLMYGKPNADQSFIVFLFFVQI